MIFDPKTSAICGEFAHIIFVFFVYCTENVSMAVLTTSNRAPQYKGGYTVIK